MTDGRPAVRHAAVGRCADRRPRLHRSVRPPGRAGCRPHPPGARGRPHRGRARYRRPDGQARQRPCQRPRLGGAAGDRPAGADGAGHEPEDVVASGDPPQPRDAGRRTASASSGRTAARWPSAPRPAKAAWPSRWRSSPPSRRCSTPGRSRLPAARSSSPRARPMSRSTRCATSPTVRRASRVMRLPRHWPGLAPTCGWSPARCRLPIRPA